MERGEHSIGGRGLTPWRPIAGRSAAAMLVLLTWGCAPKPPPVPRGYFGPTEPLSAVVQRINANNQLLPTLYARHHIEAYIVQQGKTRFVNSDGDLFLLKPRGFYLRGTKDIAGKIFEMGSNAQTFWFTAYLDENTRWWGHYANVGKPCAQEIPIRPDLVGEVLGIGNIDTDLLEPPVPTLQFNNDLDVYMISWHARRADRWTTEKQIYYDRQTLLPRKVLLLDDHGRVVLRANLANHQPVQAPGTPQPQWPKIATSYQLFFPDSGSTMTLQLTDLVLRNRAGQPKETLFAMREDREVRQEIQIDADCEK